MEEIETIIQEPSKQSHPLLSFSLSGDSAVFYPSVEDLRLIYALSENKLKELLNQKRQIEEEIRKIQDKIIRMEIELQNNQFCEIRKIQSNFNNIKIIE
ncbi:hypothetical protein DDB_G0285121 [Dictyostelium discoideum AX4]|uniref:Uncharacterized protein n=1 Tax=Dictyostelium discoideum TaxID=44689 RepID=Q54NN8_DICDI|nr:hypothetical protein DDB_G0285121 [Dictyostelium discoideum AX4]EAL64873.1 hypothetical protein DDB_G0285121 [Dictyostelium discoideum AX4]|eukprot:XP_639878.1 hypothetical protein DDB_G0285121 [Dictyostelium discoideum AX4]